MRKHLAVLLLLALPLASTQAQDQYVQQLIYQIEEASAALASAGYTGILGDGGALEHQGYQDFNLRLTNQASYVALGVCDEDCSDLDIELYDGYGNLVAADESEDDAPIVEFQVVQGGDFTLRVRMYTCHAEPCYYGVGVYGR